MIIAGAPLSPMMRPEDTDVCWDVGRGKKTTAHSCQLTFSSKFPVNSTYTINISGFTDKYLKSHFLCTYPSASLTYDRVVVKGSWLLSEPAYFPKNRPRKQKQL